MSKLLLCMILSATVSTVSAQKVYFVYLQTENEQPFYVKINEQVYSSTASGYLILSKLRDSTYNFSLGFPQNKWPDQQFSVTINKKDHGFIVKNFGEKGWGLFNLKDLSVQMSSAPKSTGSIKNSDENVSVFTDILSKATDDPSLKEKQVIVQTEEKKNETEPQHAVVKEDTRIVTPEPALVKTETVNQPVKEVGEIKAEENKVPPATNKTTNEIVNPEAKIKEEKADYKPSVVKKSSENITADGQGIVFIDSYEDGKKDTIQITIPVPHSMVAAIKDKPKEEKKFIEIIEQDTIEKKPPVEKNVAGILLRENRDGKTVDIVRSEDKPAVKPLTQNKCSSIATDNDFLKLRKKMAAETDDDDMVDEARKYFRNVCFTTVQMKNLAALFLDDLGKYKFFDVAYLFVSDIENFPNLQSELKNEYYINRFKAMLK